MSDRAASSPRSDSDTAASRLLRRFLAPLPPERLAWLRLAICGYATLFVLVRLPYHLDLARLPEARFDPLGLWWWLTAPLPVAAVAVLGVITAGFGVLSVAGWRYRLVGPLFGALLTAFLTYGHCWGQVLHTENLLALHVLVLGVAPAADRLRWRNPRSRPGSKVLAASLPPTSDATPLSSTSPEGIPSHSNHGWPIRLMAAITALTYAVAGYAKLRNGGLAWMTGDVLRSQIAHDNLRKSLLGDPTSPVVQWVLPHRLLFPPMALASMALELGAPLALVLRRMRVWWVGAIWLFHVATLVLMAVFFPYHLFGLAFLPHLLSSRTLPMRRRSDGSKPWPRMREAGGWPTITTRAGRQGALR